MITTNILQRVLFIKYSTSIGTSFTIEVNNNQYLISAKHIFSEITKTVDIEILKDNIWQRLTVEPIFCDNQIDIIAFKLERPITPQYELIPSRDKLVLSQDAFFLGFPYGLKTDSFRYNNGYPVPFVKKCSISAMDKEIIYLDGHNNIRTADTTKMYGCHVVGTLLTWRAAKAMTQQTKSPTAPTTPYPEQQRLQHLPLLCRHKVPAARLSTNTLTKNTSFCQQNFSSQNPKNMLF